MLQRLQNMQIRDAGDRLKPVVIWPHKSLSKS